jgi:hypothetical protein
MIVEQKSKREREALGCFRIQQPVSQTLDPFRAAFAFSFCPARPREHKPERHWLIVGAESP